MFGVWQQSVLSRVSGISLQSRIYVWPQNNYYLEELTHPIKLAETSPNSRLNSLLMPYDPLVEEYFNREDYMKPIYI